FEHVFHCTESQWSWPHAGSSQASQSALFAVRIEHRGHAGQSKISVSLRKLLKRPPARRGGHGEPHLDHYLIRSESSGQVGHEELLSPENTCAAGVLQNQFGFQSSGYRRVFGSGIGVAQTSTKRTTRTNRQVSDQSSPFMEQR